VLEQREVLRVGSLRPRPIDVRFISATNRDLEEEIAYGRFREDLYYRLQGVVLEIPPLRARVEEIGPLARSFLAEACRASGRARVPEIASSAMALLESHSWPGNIRELRNVIERSLLFCMSDEITLECLPLERMGGSVPLRAVGRRGARARPPSLPPLAPYDKDEDKRRIMAALRDCRGNQSDAAKVLGISRRTLVSRLGEYELPRPRKKA
jgi:DNA-binding NtrC family response regulator